MATAPAPTPAPTPKPTPAPTPAPPTADRVRLTSLLSSTVLTSKVISTGIVPVKREFVKLPTGQVEILKVMTALYQLQYREVGRASLGGASTNRIFKKLVSGKNICFQLSYDKKALTIYSYTE